VAEQEIRKSLPTLPQSQWWALRRKFRQSIPGVVTDSYLATVLDMTPLSARTNVMPALRTMGIIDQSGKPTDRAKLWRDNESYKSVCQAIVKEIYPAELVDAVPTPWENEGKAEKWIANHTGTGTNASRKMAALYEVLLRADSNFEQKSQEKTASKKDVGSTEKKTATSKRTSPPIKRTAAAEAIEDKHSPQRKVPPAINLNLQIHISADASADQIEQIFSSMSKHIYKDS
jgi:Family of unknown function (DUF5343)